MQIFIITILITTVLSFACGMTYGQTFSEWWQQKRTRIKYLRQQEAALEALKETVENGYDQAAEGIDSIATITGHELDLHKLFLKNLKSVKLAFKDCPERAASRGLAIDLMARLLNTMRSFPDDPEFTYSAAWFNVYMSVMTKEIVAKLKELDDLTADNVYEMKDSERYEKIHAKAAHVRAMYESGISFLSEIEEWLIIRQTNANEEFVRRHL